MYFPYVRGRQFELLAIKELVSKSLISENIVPVVEPVKLSPTLVSTIEEFIKKQRKIAIIRNPSVGSFFDDLQEAESDDKAATYVKNFNNLFLNPNVVKSIILQKDSEELLNIWKKEGISNKDIMAILQDRDSLSLYENLFDNDNVPFFAMFPDERAFSRKIKTNKIVLDDKFTKQERNADYGKKNDEFFSEDHLYYEDEQFIGFSDYSVIGSEYMEAGFAPYAVAIHIVYFDSNEVLRVRHFVSKSNDDISNPALKYYEALTDLYNWYMENAKGIYLTLGLKTFLEHYKNQSYPGLGTVKKLSVMHHLELVSHYLEEK